MSLRYKILSGFLILAIMLFVAGLWSIYELNAMGDKVETLLHNNYKKVTLAKVMKESLEKEETATMLKLLGNSEEADILIANSDSTFRANLNKIRSISSDSADTGFINSIQLKYNEFHKIVATMTSQDFSNSRLDWYTKNARNHFLETVEILNNFINREDKFIYNSSVEIEGRARRAITPGIAAVVAAIVFTLLFNFFINHYVISPITETKTRIRKFLKDGKPFEVKVETKDEIADLVDEVTLLCSHVDNESYQ